VFENYLYQNFIVVSLFHFINNSPLKENMPKMKSSIINVFFVLAFVACIMTPVNAILRGMNKNTKRILQDTPNKTMYTITSEKEVDDDEVSTKTKNLLRRVVVEGRITLIGINHDTPLTGAESMFLEDSLLEVINEETIDDPSILTKVRTVVIVHQETDPSLYNPTFVLDGISDDDNNKSDDEGNRLRRRRSMLRHLSSTSPLTYSFPSEDYLDETVLLEYECYHCDDDYENNVYDDDTSDGDGDDDDDDVDDNEDNKPKLEDNLCNTLQMSNLSRFHEVKECQLAFA
jgi:hypothetical protein